MANECQNHMVYNGNYLSFQKRILLNGIRKSAISQFKREKTKKRERERKDFKIMKCSYLTNVICLYQLPSLLKEAS